MPIQPMADAVAGEVASSAEYNKVVDNIIDLDTRLGPLEPSATAHARIGELDTRLSDPRTGNIALDQRVTALEAGKAGLAEHARYYNDAAQPIANETWVKLDLPKTHRITGYVTQNGTDFTINTAGVYTISACIRFAPHATGTRHLIIGPSADTDNRHTAASTQTMPGNPTLNCTTNRHFDIGDTLAVWTSQGSGAALNTAPLGETIHLAITFNGP